MKNKITEAIQRAIPLKDLLKHIRERETVELKGFSGSTLSISLGLLQDSVDCLLMLTTDMEQAAAIASDLGEINPDHTVLLFPPTNRKPYDLEKVNDFSTAIQRSEVLGKLKSGGNITVVTSADAISEKVLPADLFLSGSILLKREMNQSPDDLREELVKLGYNAVTFVDEPGEFAVRGGIFDIFPWSSEFPIRLEFFGDTIDSIREFDPDSQRSIAFLTEIRLVPNAVPDHESAMESLFRYLPRKTLCVLKDPALVKETITELFIKAETQFQSHEDASLQPPQDIYLTADEFQMELMDMPLFLTGTFLDTNFQPTHTVALKTAPHPELNGSFKLLREFISSMSKKETHTIILCENQNQRERFEELLGEPGSGFDYQIGIFTLHEGFTVENEKLAVLTDHQIFNRYHRPKLRKRKTVKGSLSFKEIRELNIGDFVVHVDYGIGKFNGFKKIKVKDTVQESAVIRYQDDSLLYVNVSSLHKLQKYSGKEGNAPRVTKLGSGDWIRKKQKTSSKVKDIARELITLYAKRKASDAFAFSPDSSWQTELEARFEFEETPDQLKAIESVKEDMTSSEPMDRLICGDVGFGKTEVAVRAAFKAVMDQKQVAILVPTTILADQHFKTFSKRMADFPVRIDVLSRFRSTGEQTEVLKQLKEGKIDILIGTHRLVSKDVEFRELGLLVVDEEQRFGVSVKEKLKSLRLSIDVLTLTATPIPRTMQFSLMGARDLSIINTPPPNRQPVYTEIHSFNHELIRDAILRELSRGGQVFFIHNRVGNIESVAELITGLIPDIRVRTAHGQMKASALEKIIHDFYSHKFDVLVSTNIVENGIDIANANTIIINNANHFGLSELHQLRGRVGRSMRKAFCYLLTPPVQSLTSDARKRLQALVEFSDLGSGFNIAMRDLDIRGAGDILGAEQSGFINELGFEMYTKILDNAIKELKQDEFQDLFESEKILPDKPDSVIEFDASALLDSDYVSDNVERLNLYRKLASITAEEGFSEWEEEVTDRFGPMNRHAVNLFQAAKIKYYSAANYFPKVTIRSGRMWIVCPKSNTEAGQLFYNQGHFQRLLDYLGQSDESPFQVTQKKETLRLVIDNIDNLNDAVLFLKKVTEMLTPQLSEP